ncbi:1,4-dihydroxy-2-naphthoate octaprenyltransferase [Psychrobacter sp. FDAARGOS_221]|uniref:1,4-dihydroxy-2-naphthoate octaprenyltransferase n=1 Tax=Psychrobacter sp. FDAARGOS_221 TaxID=1975705 RepID=UPI000BB59CF7|nr:1,4-dihydroxy-2-naphthoate octaprenyltransferase [Psychrobacter sp. FDAARGOS_221]PNK60111.1 1,4-dihydroxy-2-naphthoate octaprenyltransferase [Psychrobacter sp. FDAARGOS_221]
MTHSSQVSNSSSVLVKAFLQATRPRTFPLAIASIVCGSSLGLSQLVTYDSIGWHNWLVLILTFWVALALQILSNLANDYGDGVKGTDDLRDASSPQRMLAGGQLQPEQFKKIIIGWAALTFFSGVLLIALGFDNLSDFLLFLAFGIIAILAAMAYTMGKRPYGYRAMGEVAVLLFFGWLAVLGSAYLQTQQFNIAHLIVATGCGGLAACVLFVNNMRDIYSDKQAGKITLAVLLGDSRMQSAYGLLFMASYLCYLLYAINFNWYTLSVLLVYPLAYKHIHTIHRIRLKNLSDNNQTMRVDTVLIGKQLKAIVMITLIINLLFALGMIMSHLI